MKGRVRKQVIAYLKLILRQRLELSCRTKKDISQGSQCSGPYSKRVFPIIRQKLHFLKLLHLVL